MEYCFDCTRRRHSFEYGLSLINYDDYARHSMAAIKYKNKRQYLDFYSEAICQRYASQIHRMNAQALIPVPIHPSRKRPVSYTPLDVYKRQEFHGDTAVIEMAAASGLPMVPQELRDPRKTTTYGTGELLKDALDRGYRKIAVAIGGSATNDGGMGAMRALGIRFLDENCLLYTSRCV